MCGIVGWVDLNGSGPLARPVLDGMCERLRHRGPDDDGILERPGLGIAMRRLSILDVEGGQQPQSDDRGAVSVLQNGEIYNYIELGRELTDRGHKLRTRSDTEVIAHLFAEDGAAALGRLNGMFAIAAWDERTQELVLARDRLGIKPLYTTVVDGRLLFASELKCFFADPGFRAQVDPEALDLFLAMNYVPPPKTILRGVEHVPPGHLLRVRPGGGPPRLERWWTLPADGEDGTMSVEDFGQQFLELLRDAVQVHCRSDVPFGAFLSGGVDSSTVVGIMSELLPEPVRTFSIGFSDKRFDESAYAARVAQHFHTRHHQEVVACDAIDLMPRSLWHTDQPHGDASFMPTYLVAKMAAQQVKVVLTGDGGDELFAGYDNYLRLFPHDAPLTPIGAERYLEVAGLFDRAALDGIRGPELRATGGAALDRISAELAAARNLDPLNQVLWLDSRLLLPGNNLVKPDRMGMAASLEARVPFLDWRMAEWAFRVPGRLKLAGGETKYAFKRAVDGLLPHDVVYRAKQMFTVPIGEWFRGELKELPGRVLLAPVARERGLFAPAALAGMIDDHIEGRRNYTRELRALVILELWFRMNIDQTFESCPTMAELGVAASDLGVVTDGR